MKQSSSPGRTETAFSKSLSRQPERRSRRVLRVHRKPRNAPDRCSQSTLRKPSETASEGARASRPPGQVNGLWFWAEFTFPGNCGLEQLSLVPRRPPWASERELRYYSRTLVKLEQKTGIANPSRASTRSLPRAGGSRDSPPRWTGGLPPGWPSCPSSPSWPSAGGPLCRGSGRPG
jgi:hypothetical protein